MNDDPYTRAHINSLHARIAELEAQVAGLERMNTEKAVEIRSLRGRVRRPVPAKGRWIDLREALAEPAGRAFLAPGLIDGATVGADNIVALRAQGGSVVTDVEQVNALLGVNLWDVRSFRADVRIDFDEHGRVLAVSLLNPNAEHEGGES